LIDDLVWFNVHHPEGICKQKHKLSTTDLKRKKCPDKRYPPPLSVSCAPSRHEGPASYIEIKDTKNKLRENRNETKGKRKKKKEKKKSEKKKGKKRRRTLAAAARGLGIVPSMWSATCSPPSIDLSSSTRSVHPSSVSLF
jgi:hypothetical protein